MSDGYFNARRQTYIGQPLSCPSHSFGNSDVPVCVGHPVVLPCTALPQYSPPTGRYVFPCLNYFYAVVLIKKRLRNKLFIEECDTPLELSNIALLFGLGAKCSMYSVFRDDPMCYIRLGIVKTRGSVSMYHGHAKTF